MYVKTKNPLDRQSGPVALGRLGRQVGEADVQVLQLGQAGHDSAQRRDRVGVETSVVVTLRHVQPPE